MMKITREEAMELNKKGFQFASYGVNGVIHRTNTHHRTYYLTESNKALDALIELREERNQLTR